MMLYDRGRVVCRETRFAPHYYGTTRAPVPTRVRHFFIASPTVAVHSYVHVFIHIDLFTVCGVEVSVAIGLVVEVIGHVELGFRETPMSPHGHQLTVSSIVVPEHPDRQQYQQYQDEATRNGHCYHSRFEPEFSLLVTLVDKAVLCVWVRPLLGPKGCLGRSPS